MHMSAYGINHPAYDAWYDKVVNPFGELGSITGEDMG